MFEKVAKDNPKKFNNFKGFIERRIYVTKGGGIYSQANLINGTPGQKFRELIEKSGLTGIKFEEKTNHKGA